MTDSRGRPTGPDKKMPWGLIILFLTVQAAIVFGIVNPWYDAWRDPLTGFLIIEIIFFVVVFLPLFAYHLFKGGKGVRASLRASLDSFMNWMGYFTP